MNTDLKAQARQSSQNAGSGSPFKQAIAWIALIAVWVLTPFIGDRIPQAISVLYWVFVVVAVLYGLMTAIKRKSWLLGIFSVLTAFAWPIILYAVLAGFGIS